MASSWLTSWLSSWGGSWGTVEDTETPAQTGGAGYFAIGGEVKRKKRKDTLRQDIERAQEELTRVTEEIKTEQQAITEVSHTSKGEIPIYYQTPRLDHLYTQALEANLKLQSLQNLLRQIELQRDEDDVEILLLSIQ